MYTSITINDTTILLNISTPVKTSKWGNEMDKFNVEVCYNSKKEKFEFFMGIGHRTDQKNPATTKFNVESFLYCIFSDASLADHYDEDIDSFADDFGGTKPSEAIKAFRGCTESREKLGNLFGSLYESISEFILENYG